MFFHLFAAISAEVADELGQCFGRSQTNFGAIPMLDVQSFIHSCIVLSYSM